MRPEDGEHIDARDAPELNRHISLTLIAVPLGAAIEAIAAHAAIDITYANDVAPLDARVSMKADDVTVAAALAWVMGEAPLDVLVSDDGALVLVSRVSTAGGDSSGVIVGSLVDQNNGEPVPYATVTLMGTDRTRFADPTGHFRLAGLTPRRYVLRARQIGYAPIDTTLDVTSATVASVTLRLRRIPVLLQLVHVFGHRPKGCVATGAPNPAANPELAELFTQVRENVDRYRLLLDEYPFRLIREERLDLQKGARDRALSLDTVAYESRDHHPYHAGGVVFYEGDPKHGGRRYMYLPTFDDLVDTAFLATHCFSMGVFQRTRGGGVFRLDFQPADRLHTPDVAGSVFLDAQRLTVRRAEFHLTRSRDAHPPIMDLNVTATFRDFVPLVPLIDSIEGRQTIAVMGHDLGGFERELPGEVQFVVERDHVLGASFESRFPGDQMEALRSTRVDSTIRLKGRVIDTDGAPIPGAHVEGFASLNVATTDDSGRFQYFGAPPTHQVLEIRHAGYRSRRILVALGSTAAMQVALARDSVPGTTHGKADMPPPRGHSLFGADAACKPSPARDTVQLQIYATLVGRRPAVVSDMAWYQYIQRALLAIDRSFALPSDFPLRVFSAPSDRLSEAGPNAPDAPRPTAVPVFASGVAFDIDTAGSVANLRVVTPSLSGPVDTSVLATIERAETNGALPPVSRTWAGGGPVQFELLVSSVAPAGKVQSRRIGIASVPEWYLDRPAAPDSSDQAVAALQSRCTTSAGHATGGVPCLDSVHAFEGDTAAFTGIIDAHGRVVTQTVRFIPGTSGLFLQRVAAMLSRFKFSPALIGSCAVSELGQLTFSLPLVQP